MSSKQQIAVGVDVTASGTHITLMAPTDTGHMEVVYSEFHPMPPAQKQSTHVSVPRELLERVLYVMDNYVTHETPEEDELRALLNGGET